MNNNVTSIKKNNESSEFYKPLQFKKNFCKSLQKFSSIKLRSKIDLIFYLSIVTFLISIFFIGRYYYRVGEIEINSLNKVSASLLAIIIACYWGRDKLFGRKWAYCANVYNKIFLELMLDNSVSKNSINYARVTLAADLMDCGLWNHKSFYTEFNITFERIAKSENKSIYKISNGEMSWDEARGVISNHLQNIEKAILKNKKGDDEAA